MALGRVHGRASRSMCAAARCRARGRRDKTRGKNERGESNSTADWLEIYRPRQRSVVTNVGRVYCLELYFTCFIFTVQFGHLTGAQTVAGRDHGERRGLGRRGRAARREGDAEEGVQLQVPVPPAAVVQAVLRRVRLERRRLGVSQRLGRWGREREREREHRAQPHTRPEGRERPRQEPLGEARGASGDTRAGNQALQDGRPRASAGHHKRRLGPDAFHRWAPKARVRGNGGDATQVQGRRGRRRLRQLRPQAGRQAPRREGDARAAYTG